MKRLAAAFDWHGVDGAGQFPHRCLGDAADLHRQAAGDPARPATGRAACRAPPRSRCRPAARWSSARPAGPPRRRHQRRHDDAKAGAERDRWQHGAWQEHDQGRAPTSGASSSTTRARSACAASSRSDLTWQFTAIPDKPPTIALAKDPEGAGARRAAAHLQARRRLRRHRRAGDLQALEVGRHRTARSAARALSRRRTSRSCCRRRAPGTASARPSRT